jgi:hypothetical protein
MSVTRINDYQLAGAEYWPYRGSVDINYPDDVLWGFYPQQGVIADGETTPNVDSANPAAIACAERAFVEWKAFINSDPPALRTVAADPMNLGYDKLFYLWTNDYSQADAVYAPGVRDARLWYWLRRVPKAGRPPGFWKWESTLDQQGVCHTPDPAQIAQYLAQATGTLDVLRRIAPECRGKELNGAALKNRCQMVLKGDRLSTASDVEITSDQVAPAKRGTMLSLTLTIKNKLALPLVVEPDLEAPIVERTDKSPIPGNVQCSGHAYGRSSTGSKVFALDGDGQLTWPVEIATTYVGCDNKKYQLVAGRYRATWLGFDISFDFEVGG